jgi:hypothetical protein
MADTEFESIWNALYDYSWSTNSWSANDRRLILEVERVLDMIRERYDY